MMQYFEKTSQSIDETARKLQAIIETAIDGIIMIDASGTILTFNEAASKIFGYGASEVIGKNVAFLMPQPDRAHHDQYIDNYLETGNPKIIGIGREVNALHKDGHIFPIRLAVSEIKGDNKRIFTGIIHDLTEVKMAEEKFLKLNQELESKVAERTEELASVVNKLLAMNKTLKHEISERKQAEVALKNSKEELRISLEKEKELGELKSRFVSMASHEFRTPLSTILSSTALLSRYTETGQQPKRDKHIARIKSAVQNLNGILNEFLSLSKLEEGKIAYKAERFSFVELVREVIDEFQGLLKPGQEIIHTHFSASSEVTLDRRIVKNILFNLLSNAVKYSQHGTKIACRSKLDGPLLLIEIEDQGMGIPVKDQQYLFTRFFRASNSTNIQGTGLGLTIVKQYVDLMNGSIRFTSVEDEGTTFFVTLSQNVSTE